MENSLNVSEDQFAKEFGVNFQTKMMNYFMMTSETDSLVELLAYEKDEKNKDYDSDDDDGSSTMSDLEDDMVSDDEDSVEESSSEIDNRCGTNLVRIWNKRSIALRSDIAIAGWMCSPLPEIMADCTTYHRGEHKQAVTRLLRQWFGHEV